MLEKVFVLGKIEVLEGGEVQVRQDTVIMEDGVELSRTYHRIVLSPGSDLTDHPRRLIDVCAAVWTPDVVTAYQAKQDARDSLTEVKG